MAECFRCGVSGDKVGLFDAISGKGIVQICEKCSIQDDIPIIKRPTKFQLNTSHTPYTVYERLSRMAGLKAEEHKEKVRRENYERGRNDKGQEATLRQIVDKGFQKKAEVKEVRDDLVDNFHWVVQRARRLRKLTQEQVAKEIDEPVTAIMAMERGVVPRDRPVIVSKLETFYRVKINRNTILPPKEETSLKQDIQEIERHKIKPEDLKFDKESSGKLTIADLRELKKGIDSKKVSVKQGAVDEDIVFEDDVFEEK